MDYQLYELPSEDFENLIYHLCLIILGEGTTKFRKGKDGGRDARFDGTANSYPSESSPWSGKFIIQAKGEGDVKDSCSDTSFDKILNEEITKIKKLKENNEVGNYLLFTSRRITANKDAQIIIKLEEEISGIKFAVIGRETLTELINKHPELIKRCNLKRFYSPLRIHPQLIKETIKGFENCRGKISESILQTQENVDYISKIKKNKLNKLSEEYFKFIKRNSLIYFKEIDEFLKDLKNQKFKELYLDTVSEMGGNIIISRKDFDKFDEIFGHLYDLIWGECSKEISEKRLITIFLHYMYWNCDIGKKVNEDD